MPAARLRTWYQDEVSSETKTRTINENQTEDSDTKTLTISENQTKDNDTKTVPISENQTDHDLCKNEREEQQSQFSFFGKASER